MTEFSLTKEQLAHANDASESLAPPRLSERPRQDSVPPGANGKRREIQKLIDLGREKGFLTLSGIHIFWNSGECGKNPASLSKQFAASPNRRFELRNAVSFSSAGQRKAFHCWPYLR